jgi:hypothetical protein
MILPPFVNGIDYRELTPREGNRRWRWEMLRDHALALPFACPAFSCHNSDGWEWMRVEKGLMTIRAGYRWNGCSPKRWVPILGWMGTPDRPRNMRGSCFHDSLYQASGFTSFPMSRERADDLFLQILTADKFCLANLYHGAVTDFGANAWGNRRAGQYINFPPSV